MAIRVDILQDSGGDFDVSQGFRLTPSLKVYVAQKLSQTLSWFLGEWFLDTRKGFPYFKAVLGQRYDKRLVDSLFRRAIELTPGVGDVPKCESAFTPSTRIMTLNGEVITTVGDVLPIDFVVPLSENP